MTQFNMTNCEVGSMKIQGENVSLQVEFDESPSGFIEYMKGADGKYRAYVRLVDHQKIVDQISKAHERDE